jgi:hypothetical protein
LPNQNRLILKSQRIEINSNILTLDNAIPVGIAEEEDTLLNEAQRQVQQFN